MTNPEDIESDFDIHALSPHLRSPEAAVEYLERLRWPEAHVCPKCGESNRRPYFLRWTGTKRKLWKCAACRQQYTVTVGTIFEDSKITLDKWLLAFHLLCSSKKGMSALQIQRMLGLGSYKTALFMCHRIRWAMAEPAFVEKMAGVVEADETYIGGKARNRKRKWAPNPNKNVGRGKGKEAVMVVVERGGRARSKHIANVTSDSIKGVIRDHVERSARMMTDGFSSYRGLHHEFATHEVIDHAMHEYVRGDVHTNTAESYFAILKRGVNGVYHHVSEVHLHRYLSEFDFRYNNRAANGVDDAERTRRALLGSVGKRLMYSDSSRGGEAAWT